MASPAPNAADFVVTLAIVALRTHPRPCGSNKVAQRRHRFRGRTVVVRAVAHHVDGAVADRLAEPTPTVLPRTLGGDARELVGGYGLDMPCRPASQGLFAC